MEYIYAALLLYKAGKDITEEAVTAVLQAAGVDVVDARAKALVAALDGVDIEEAMATAAVSTAAPAAAAPTAAAAPVEEEAVEEEEDKSEESGMAGLGALFG
ncbi:50S ribosomal protein P1 [Methanolobus sp.]|jgi:large subunit ribosomal protein L12|uniref:50S ribosomal protein P1 n=1 Tax=Methanolobus sp. TaxID=1874737 RepID=UPI0025E13C87|nr:50S ribosomal protein P1 [Methanolobus sp.]